MSFWVTLGDVCFVVFSNTVFFVTSEEQFIGGINPGGNLTKSFFFCAKKRNFSYCSSVVENVARKNARDVAVSLLISAGPEVGSVMTT